MLSQLLGACDLLAVPQPAPTGMQVWLKPVAEMSFLYGNNVLKSGLGRMTEHTPAHTGVVVYSMSDVPLGFGVAAKSTADCRRADPSTVVVFHQSDVGESFCAKQTVSEQLWLKTLLQHDTC